MVTNCLNDCPTCGGDGWIVYTRTFEELGDREYEVARKCPDCAGKMREGDRCGVPTQYAKATMESFNFGAYGCDMSEFRKAVTSFVNNYSDWVELGLGLYFSSETPGSGKTFLACCIAREVMVRYDLQMRFVTATDYLAAIGDSYKRQSGTADKSKVYRECALLVLDDLGAQKEGSWQDQELFRLINTRIIEGRMTIITSNFSQENLNLNDRTVDRIMSYTMPLAMPEVSIRRKKAKEKQLSLIKRITDWD